jgi:hypothetical protein
MTKINNKDAQWTLLDHWYDCSSHLGSACDCGGITTFLVFVEFVRWNIYNLAAILGMFRLKFVRRAFHLHDKASMLPRRWIRFPWPIRTTPKAQDVHRRRVALLYSGGGPLDACSGWVES